MFCKHGWRLRHAAVQVMPVYDATPRALSSPSRFSFSCFSPVVLRSSSSSSSFVPWNVADLLVLLSSYSTS